MKVFGHKQCVPAISATQKGCCFSILKHHNYGCLKRVLCGWTIAFFGYDLRGKTHFIILGTLHSSIDAYLEVQNPGLHDAMHSLSSCI